MIAAVILVLGRVDASRSADTACREFSQQQKSQIGAAVQEILQSEQKSFALPSAGVALFDCRGLVWVGATGFSDKDQHMAAGADTVFRTGPLAGKLTVRVFSQPVAYAEMQSYDAPRMPAPASQPPGTFNTTLRDMASLGSRWLATPKRNSVSNTSAVPGFVSKLSLLPAAGIGVFAYAALDRSSAAAHIADYALQVALAVRDGKQLPANPTSRPLNAAEALPLVGEYRHDGATVEVRWMNGAAFIETPRLAGRLQRGPSGYVMDDYTVPLSLKIDPSGGWLEADGVRFIRSSHNKPAPPAPEITGLIGDYGWDHESIRVFERDGSLFLRTGGVLYDSMARVTADVWKFPPNSPSHPGQQVKFSRDSAGSGTSLALNGVSFPRHNIIIDPPAGKLSETDRARLRQRAMAAEPPRESEPHEPAALVSIASIDHSIKLDVRYATSQNLLGFPVYSKSAAYLQRPAAEALARADQKLHARGFGIVVFDAYRPWFVTKMFWDGTPEAAHVFVADPSQGSRHNRGAAVDISLIELASAREVTMTGAYDEFSPRSYPLYDGGTAEQRWRRDVLREALESENFTVYQFEWWHFDYADWRRYGLLNIEFAQLPP
ncbi:MAG: M15 family metallopeptidase [Proteobacteria bacterium]|nr:M15 family metallopeptidase [Pseudomonadota bacterium]